MSFIDDAKTNHLYSASHIRIRRVFRRSPPLAAFDEPGRGRPRPVQIVRVGGTGEQLRDGVDLHGCGILISFMGNAVTIVTVGTT